MSKYHLQQAGWCQKLMAFGRHVSGPVCFANVTGMSCRHRAGFKSLRGPQYAVPLVGCIIAMVKNPYQFWEDQRKCVPETAICWQNLHLAYFTFLTQKTICLALTVCAPAMPSATGCVPQSTHDISAPADEDCTLSILTALQVLLPWTFLEQPLWQVHDFHHRR